LTQHNYHYLSLSLLFNGFTYHRNKSLRRIAGEGDFFVGVVVVAWCEERPFAILYLNSFKKIDFVELISTVTFLKKKSFI